jgi:hypothetical protein
MTYDGMINARDVMGEETVVYIADDIGIGRKEYIFTE